MTDDVLSELRDWYQQRGLAARVGFGTGPAVLVVDMQRGFTDPGFSLGADADDVIASVNTLTEAARLAGAPVVFTVCVYVRDAETWARKLPGQRDLAPGSEWVELDPRIARAPGDLVLEKHFASAFFETGLGDILRARGVDTVVTTGMTTSGCVRASTVDACSQGFRVAVPAEAVGDRAALPHQANLFDIDAKYGDVVSSADVLTYFKSLSVR